MNSVNSPAVTLTLRWSAALLLGFISMLLLPVLTHSILVHPPEYDELLHILAARSLNETGLPSIADGLYLRAEPYTRLIAWTISFSDNELVVARLPALLFGMLATAMLTIWVSMRVGWLAAIAVAVLFVISPMTLNSAVLVRFYTLHTLLMTAMLLFWFDASYWARTPKNIAVIVIVSAVLIWLGLQFHELTQITILAGITGFILLLLFDQKDRLQHLVVHYPLLCIVLMAGLIGALVFTVISFDIMSMLRGSVPLWSVNKAGNYAYYISALSVHLPFIWPLFPLMVICAFYENTRLTVFCLTVFVVGLIVNSIAAQKATRYFYHAYPMFCILWAIGFQRAFLFATSELQRRRHFAPFSSMLIVIVVLSFCLVNAHEVKRAVKLVLDRGELDETIPVKSEPDWTKALPHIGELAQSVDTLVVTSGVKGMYAFGRFDYEMSTTVVQETDTGLDFGNDPRTNRPVIGQPESVETIINAEGRALFVLEDRMINKSFSSPLESVLVLKKRCETIDLSASGSQLSAWLC